MASTVTARMDMTSAIRVGRRLDHRHQALQFVTVDFVRANQVTNQRRRVTLEKIRHQFADFRMTNLVLSHECPIDVLTPLLTVGEDAPLLKPREQGRDRSDRKAPALHHGPMNLLRGRLPAFPQDVKDGELELGKGMSVRQWASPGERSTTAVRRTLAVSGLPQGTGRTQSRVVVRMLQYSIAQGWHDSLGEVHW